MTEEELMQAILSVATGETIDEEADTDDDAVMNPDQEYLDRIREALSRFYKKP